MSDEQRSRRWLVKVKGCDQVSVLPSQSLEIGRKPIRPLPDDGVPRFEVSDETRSMSKRHAVLRVSANGVATLRDMRSTNGTYLVREDGNLIRLPEDIDFPLPSTAVRMQFGDVPVDFVQVEDSPEPEPSPAVTDLFTYATDDEKPAEPDAADLSVDDILDLRAGEPTSAFTASRVADRASQLRAAALQSFTPMVAPLDEANRPDAIANPVPLHVEPVKPQEPRDLFVDAMEHVLPSSSDQSEATRPMTTRLPDASPATSVADTSAQVAATQQTAAAIADQPQAVQSAQSAQSTVQPAVQLPVQSETTTPATQPTVQHPITESVTAAEPAQQPAYTPAFEPGSVFDRVAKGEFRKPEPTVEVDGLTSDDAKHTTDFSVQFNMARHRELLPFLAMNPSLYDDLYAWLAARGDADIDAALADNPGYEEYRRAVGK